MPWAYNNIIVEYYVRLWYNMLITVNRIFKNKRLVGYLHEFPEQRGQHMKEISIKSIENVKIGSAENKEAGTGCTVVIAENGAPTGLDVRGGGPASRESELLKPTAAAQYIHCLLYTSQGGARLLQRHQGQAVRG